MILFIIFILFITSPSFSQSTPSGGMYAWDEDNNVWRVIKATVDGVLIASSSTATAAAPNFNTMQSPAGDTIFIKLIRDADNASDTLAADWNLVFLRIKYTRTL